MNIFEKEFLVVAEPARDGSLKSLHVRSFKLRKKINFNYHGQLVPALGLMVSRHRSSEEI